MEEEAAQRSPEAPERPQPWQARQRPRQSQAAPRDTRWSGRAICVPLVAVMVSLLTIGRAGGAGTCETGRDAAEGPPGAFTSQPSQALSHPASVPQAVQQQLGKLPMPFIQNQGQLDEAVTFYAPIFGGTVFVTQQGAVVYALSQGEGTRPRQGVVLREELVGGAGKAVQGEGQATTKLHYLKGRDQSKWTRHIPTYDCVSLGEVYAGVEVKLKASGHTAEKRFYVRPGARPEQIKVRLQGGKGVKITEQGELAVETALGTVTFSKPVAYQEAGGKQAWVAVAYVVQGSEYGFEVGAYDPTKELVIDPILAATFLGGHTEDAPAHTIALDSRGNVYVAGLTGSADFPGIGASSADSTFAGFSEAFVAKLDPTLSTLLAATFLGGSDLDVTSALALDSTGNVYVAGFTRSADFPGIGASSADSTFAGDDEAFVAKLDPTLSTLLAATFLGGSSIDEAFALALDSTGNVYVGGLTDSADFPGIGASSADNTLAFQEGFVAKLDPTLSTLLAATFLGGSSNEHAAALALDSTGNVYVAGVTDSADFPGIGASSADSTFAFSEAFVAKLDPTLSTLLAATFLGGGERFDVAHALALDSMGNVYVAGLTDSADFPGIGASSADSTFAGDDEGFVAKLDPTLSTLLAATFLGGSGLDVASAPALDSTGNVYVMGNTSASDFPGIGASSADSTFAGFNEAFVAKLDPTLSTLLAATFLGGSDFDVASALALDSTGNVYVAGVTDSADFPGVGASSADRTLGGVREAFVAKLDPALSRDGPLPGCEQQLVNDMVTFVVTQTSFDPTAGSFTITASLTHIGTEDIFQPLKVHVVTLSNGHRLLSATEGDGGPGSKQALRAGADETLTTNESVIVPLVIGLADRRPFSFFVDVEGCVLPLASSKNRRSFLR